MQEKVGYGCGEMDLYCSNLSGILILYIDFDRIPSGNRIVCGQDAFTSSFSFGTGIEFGDFTEPIDTFDSCDLIR